MSDRYYILKIAIFSIMILHTYHTYTYATSRIPEPATKHIHLSTYTQSITNELVSNMSNIKQYSIRQATIEFCNAVFDANVLRHGNTRAKYFLYDPRQSYFLYVLCTDIQDTSDIYPFVFPLFEDGTPETSYRKKQPTFQAHNIPCDAKTTLIDCDIPTHISHFFRKILNEYTTIIQAGIIGLQSPASRTQDPQTDGRLGAQINNFFAKYFLSDEACKQENTCRWPIAFKRMEKYMKHAESVFPKLEILNYQAILDDAVQKKQTECTQQAIEDGRYNIVMCGLYGEDATPLFSFTNLLYNERMYYRMYIEYYAITIKSESRFSPNTNQLSTEQGARIARRVRMLQNELNWTEQAISTTIRFLRELHITFPIHIGFLRYQEDLLGLRQDLATSMTPIYTLYDKLRNVQQKR